MSSRRKRRPRGVSTPQQDRPTIPDEEIDAEAQETEARIAAEDAALAEYDQQVRDGAEDLPEEGQEAELVVDDSPVPDSVPAQPDAFTDGDADEDWEGEGPVDPEALRGVPVAAPPIPDFEEIFERGPLAAGIRMLEALLVEARGGYVESAIDELERVTEETFTPDERLLLAEVAETERTESGLPGVAAAYQTLVRVRARVQQS